MNFKIYAYILMDNHYHLLMQTLDEPLSKIMHQINNVYSKYYNYKYGHFGHVFKGRYKGILVLDENHLIELVKYIEQNPVKAKMCTSVWQYKWSSDIFFRKNLNGFIDIDDILNMLSKNRSEAIKKYKKLIGQIEDKDFENVKVIGEDAYKKLSRCLAPYLIIERLKNQLRHVLSYLCLCFLNAMPLNLKLILPL